jgi:hypothetical protein
MQDTHENAQQSVYRAHDHEKHYDSKGRLLKFNTDTRRWVIDTPEAEKDRRQVLKYEKKVREAQLVREAEKRHAAAMRKSDVNKEFHEQLDKDRIYYLDEDARRLDVWTTTDASGFYTSLCGKYVSPNRVRGWAKKGWLEYERDTEHGRYVFRAYHLMKCWKYMQEHPEPLMEYHVREYARLHQLGTFAEK